MNLGSLDTGSHVTINGQNMYQAMDWEVLLQPHDTTVLTVDGTRHEIRGLLFLLLTQVEIKRLLSLENHLN